jgi:hypothetical protein
VNQKHQVAVQKDNCLPLFNFASVCSPDTDDRTAKYAQHSLIPQKKILSWLKKIKLINLRLESPQGIAINQWKILWNNSLSALEHI